MMFPMWGQRLRLKCLLSTGRTTHPFTHPFTQHQHLSGVLLPRVLGQPEE